MRLLDRVLTAVAWPAENLWLRPWGVEQRLYAATMSTSVPAAGLAEALAQVLVAARRVSSAWTVDLDPPGRALAQAWTPHEYRSSAMDGLYAASVSLGIGDVGENTGLDAGTRARLVRLRCGAVVHVVRRVPLSMGNRVCGDI